ncbi:MAG TPA: M3 family oligoendopeptidase [Chloroflexota bacterium]
MTMSVPDDVRTCMTATWSEIEPRYRDLLGRTVDAGTADSFLRDWTAVSAAVFEAQQRLKIATDQNTADEDAKHRYGAFMDAVFPAYQAAEQELRQKFLASGVVPEGLAVPLKRMREQVELFREDNVLLLAEEQKLSTEYFAITGAQTVQWQGREVPAMRMVAELQNPDRAIREQAWRLITERRLADREAINDLWRRLLRLRVQIARNAGCDTYREYRWRQLMRFDYTPDDCKRFHRAVETVVVPALRRAARRRQERLGVDRLRPWDTDVDPRGRPALHPAGGVEELGRRSTAVFRRVHPAFGEYFETMMQGSLLDLESRANKAPAGYNMTLPASRMPFIFMHAIGVHRDVVVLVHEGGHAFHSFEANRLPYLPQRMGIPAESAEVASMSMELLTLPYLDSDDGGFYPAREANRARYDAIQPIIRLLAHTTMIDAFQHWVYENPEDAMDTAQCDHQFAELTERFLPVADFTGLEEAQATGWQPILHIHALPFYVIEYAFAQLGALQIWAAAMQDQQSAVERYRRALSLGNTVSVPEFYEAAGARFAFDEEMVRFAVELLEREIERFDAAA